MGIGVSITLARGFECVRARAAFGQAWGLGWRECRTTVTNG